MVSPKLTLREAMITLRTMFPSFDEETIKGVLYQTNGHMERTIEVLLSMVDEGEDTTQQSSSVFTNSNNNTSGAMNNSPSAAGIGHTLDEDFLRYSNLDPASSSQQQQQQHQEEVSNQDEYYAQRLQQALFEQGLSNLPSQTTHQQHVSHHNRPPAYEHDVDNYSPQYHTNSSTVRRNVDSGYSTRGIASSNSTDASTFDQLSDFAKKKFSDFKKKYFANNRNANNQPVTDPEEETINRGLLRDDDDEENDRL